MNTKPKINNTNIKTITLKDNTLRYDVGRISTEISNHGIKVFPFNHLKIKKRSNENIIIILKRRLIQSINDRNGSFDNIKKNNDYQLRKNVRL